MVEARWFAEKSVPRVVVKLMAYLARRALDQDRQVQYAKSILAPQAGSSGRLRSVAVWPGAK